MRLKLVDSSIEGTRKKGRLVAELLHGLPSCGIPFSLAKVLAQDCTKEIKLDTRLM